MEKPYGQVSVQGLARIGVNDGVVNWVKILADKPGEFKGQAVEHRRSPALEYLRRTIELVRTAASVGLEFTD